MHESKHLLNVTGVFLLGFIAVLASVFIYLFLAPLILSFAHSALVLISVFVVIWATVYIAMVLGAAVYYINKSREAETAEKSSKQAKKPTKKQDK